MKIAITPETVAYLAGEEMRQWITDAENVNKYVPGLIDLTKKEYNAEDLKDIINKINAAGLDVKARFTRDCWLSLIPTFEKMMNNMGEYDIGMYWETKMDHPYISDFPDLDVTKLFNFLELKVNDDYLKQYLKEHPKGSSEYTFFEPEVQDKLWDITCMCPIPGKSYFEGTEPEFFMAIKQSLYDAVTEGLYQLGFKVHREYEKELAWEGHIPPDCDHTHAEPEEDYPELE